MNIFNIEKAFQKKKVRGYEKIYIAIDLHDVIIEGKFSRLNEGREFYPLAKEILQLWTARKDIVLILWSSSHQDALDDITKWFDEHSIRFDYYNENPDFPSNELCDFSKKFAFDIFLEDKAGFEGATDWSLIKYELERIGELKV
jgi:hypothetical protein